MSKEKDLFVFELEESLFFEKGQEVSEMVGISLDPNISIQSFNEYISIRGVIDLQGEYEKVEQDVEEEVHRFDFDAHHGYRYFERVVDTEDGRAVFSHQFPVEISIPAYRVTDLNEVTVSIESFDYELPNESQLKLHAAIEIQGISDHADTTKVRNNPVQDEEEVEEEIFEFEIKDLPEEDDRTKQTEVQKEVSVINEVEQEQEVREQAEVIDEVVAEQSDELAEELSEEDRWKLEKKQSFDSFFKNESKETMQEDKVEALEEAEEILEVQEQVQEQEENHVPSVNTVSSEEVESTEAIESSEPEELVEEEKKAKGLGFLANLFREDRDEEEETYTKMRICIVQEQDTLDTIAKRYEVPKLQLLKQNRLEDDAVSEGQLLSIPVQEK